MQMEFTVVCTLRKGRIFLLENFWDHDEALEAAGLRE
jgi:ketosteroid isomerase-like protein